MWRSLIAAMVVACLLAACAVQAPRAPEGGEQRPSGFPEDFYLEAAQLGRPVFAIDPALSLAVIEVRRGGSLARLGHDHVVASHNVRGYVAPSEARADLYIRLDELVVDEPELRIQAGFDTQPTEEAVAATRRNMLAQLQIEQHPFAQISVKGVDEDAAGRALHASITLNGTTRSERIPVQVEQSVDQLTVSGALSLEQTQFGIVPASLLGGALLVQDRVDVRFVIHARRPPH